MSGNFFNLGYTNVSQRVLEIILKKLVTRLPNFPDRRIRYEFYFKKNRRNEKINFWNFTNFFTVGVGKGVVFFIILKYFKQLLPSQPRAIL